MFNSRRVKRVEEPEIEALPETPFDHWAEGDDRVEQFVRYAESDLEAHARAGQAQMRAVEAVAAELEASVAAQPPRAARGRVQKTYDPWDDDALSALPGEYGFEEADGLRADAAMPPPAMARDPAASGRRRMMLLAAVASVAVILAGSGVWWLLRDGVSVGFGDPQVVRAPTTPWKIVPEKGDAIDEPVDGEAVFDQVQGVPAKKEERLLTREGEVPSLPGVTPQVSPVTLDGQEIDAGAPEPVSPADVGPRRVRTVLVKPNGDIIETPQKPTTALTAPTDLAPTPPASDAIGALAGNDAPPATFADEEGSSAGLPPIPSADQSTVAGNDGAAAIAAPAAPAADPAPAVADAGVPAAPVADAPVAAAPADDAQALLPPAPEPAAAPKPRPVKSTRVADAAPLDLAATAAAPAPEPAPVKRDGTAASVDPAAVSVPDAPAPTTSAPAPAGGAYVQVSSQRSEAAAISAFQAMQRKFPSVLGGLSPDIQKADLGAKGIYYRARVPAASRDAAAALCQSLRAAGGDCVLSKK